ncbi:MAG: hypothetical protein ABIK64_01960 [Bacillota bacterium]
MIDREPWEAFALYELANENDGDLTEGDWEDPDGDPLLEDDWEDTDDDELIHEDWDDTDDK